MKIPLHYQMSEYDCGPTTMLNAISYLFEVEEIPPEVIRNIMLYSLDCYNDEGRLGEIRRLSATSCCTASTAIMMRDALARWGRAGVQ